MTSVNSWEYCIVWLKFAKRVALKFSKHPHPPKREANMWGDRCVSQSKGKSFHNEYIYQIIIFYILNILQFYVSITPQ